MINDYATSEKTKEEKMQKKIDDALRRIEEQATFAENESKDIAVKLTECFKEQSDTIKKQKEELYLKYRLKVQEALIFRRSISLINTSLKYV